VHSREILRRLAGLKTEAQTLQDYLREVAKLSQILMRASSSAIWVLDKDRDGFAASVVARAGGEPVAEGKAFLPADSVKSLGGNSAATPPYPDQLLGGQYRLAVPINSEGKLIAFLELAANKSFAPWRMVVLEGLAQQVSAAIKSIRRTVALEDLNATLREIAEAESETEVMTKVLAAALRLTETSLG